MKNSTVIPIAVGALAAGAAAVAFSMGSRRTSAASNSKPAANGGAKYTPEDAAKFLRLYLTKADGVDWGSKASPNPIIRDAQRDMGGIAADGVYGPETQKRGSQLTMSSWPARPAAAKASKPAAKPAAKPSTIPSNPVQLISSSNSTPAAATKPASSTSYKPAASKPTAAPTPNKPPGATVDLPAQVVLTDRSPKQAAQALYNYVTPIIRSGRGASDLGSKAKPNDTIAAAQRDMRNVASDGIYGPKTQARGKELLGMEFPSRYGTGTKIASAPPVPTNTKVSEQARAAEGLLAYLEQPGADQGVKGKPSAYVKAAQAAMGALTADGIYGPATRARGTQLTGKSFPPRR